MATSDSTVSRALHWLHPEQLEQFQRSLLPLIEQQGLSRICLAPHPPTVNRAALQAQGQLLQPAHREGGILERKSLNIREVGRVPRSRTGVPLQ